MNPPPNILWISFEDTSPRFGCHGDPVARTPVVDALARDGRLYRNAFCTAPVCAPSRCSIITGMYAASIGAQHMRTSQAELLTTPPYECVPPPFVKLIPEYLRAAGYFCANNSKTDYQFTPPFTAWDECGGRAHWRRRSPGQPFFAVFNLMGTHESHQWPEQGGEPQTDPGTVTLPPYLPDTLECRKALARQYDHIGENDRIAGEILGQLDDDGVADNTIVMLWSDHGEGLPRSKRWPYDTGLRVPLIVRWPGNIPSGDVSDQLVSMIDLGPTILSLAGVALPRHFQGQPFVGPAAGEREFIFATRDRYDEFHDCIRAVRDRRFKYIRNICPEQPRALWNDYLHRHPIQQELFRLKREGRLTPEQEFFFFAPSRPPEELYRLEDDPWERVNLAADPAFAGELASLRRTLDEWQREIGDLYREPESQMIERFWPGGVQPVTAEPLVIALTDDDPGIVPLAGGEATLGSPCLIQLHGPTQGASIGYTLEKGESGWRLYQGPFPLPSGEHSLRVRAERIGYAPSGERSICLKIVEKVP